MAFFFEGNNNLLHESSLDYVLEAIQFPIFHLDLYPTLIEKAAALCWFIIKDHVFFDGNKRTGILALILFLEGNGSFFGIDHEIIDVTEAVGKNTISWEDFIAWTKSKTAL